MKKLSLQEYAEREKISLVTVNKRVSKGLVTSEKVGNRRYIIVEDYVESTIPTINTNDSDSKLINYLERENKLLRKNNKVLTKEISKLNKQLNKEKENTSDTYLRYINQLENNRISAKKSENIEDVKNSKKKGKKKMNK